MKQKNKQEPKHSAIERKTVSMDVEIEIPNLDDLYGKTEDWKTFPEEKKKEIQDAFIEFETMRKFLNKIYGKNAKHIPGYSPLPGTETYLRRNPFPDNSVDELDLELITVKPSGEVATTYYPQKIQDIAHTIVNNDLIDYKPIDEKFLDYFDGLVEDDLVTVTNFGKIVKTSDISNGVINLPICWVYTYKDISRNWKENKPYLCGVYYELVFEKEFHTFTKVTSSLLTKSLIKTLDDHWVQSDKFFKARKKIYEEKMKQLKEKEMKGKK